MRTTAILILGFLISCSVSAQWLGDTAMYEIYADSLQLNAPDTIGGTAYLSKSSDIIEDAVWEFHVNMDFNPSSSNYALVYLVSDNSALSGDGYYVKIGGTNDEVSLYRQDDGISTEIIDGEDDRVNIHPVSITVKVMRTGGLWSLYSKVGSAGYALEGEISDNTYLSSSYFGVMSVYSKTRSDLFSFTRFSISGFAFTDDVPPRLDVIEALTKHKCQVVFNEEVVVNSIRYGTEVSTSIVNNGDTVIAAFEASFVENDSSVLYIDVSDTAGNQLSTDVKLYYEPFEVTYANMIASDNLLFRLNKDAASVGIENVVLDGGNPAAITLSTDGYNASFSAPIQARTSVDLVIKGILDENGDTLKTYVTDFTYYQSEFGDIIFNEIMADPSPVVADLPEVEYVEIYNNSAFSIQLEDWQIIKDDDAYVFPECQLESGHYLIIGKNTAIAEMSDSIETLAIPSFPALTNSGMALKLECSEGNLVDYVEYDVDWYEDDFTAEGGFSLERIDVNNPSQIDNWTSSCDDNGGTPGFINCAVADNPDTEAPYVVHAYALNNSYLVVSLSEPVFNLALNHPDYYDLSGSISISSITPDDIAISSQFKLALLEPMEDEIVYELTVSGITDLSGNEMVESNHNVAVCALPDTSDIVINEIMFYPFSGEAEYVELYNNTDVPYDLSKLLITQKADEGGWEYGKYLSENKELLLPRDYIVIVDDDDVETLQNQYGVSEDKIMAVRSLPSLGNDSGDVAVILTNSTVIDYLCYKDVWHSTLLDDTRGVALERLNVDAPTNDSTNWFSASSLVDYGTPAAENSQESRTEIVSNSVCIVPEVFTPDGDGTDDFMSIKIDEDNTGGTVRIQIFNRRGILVRELCNNVLIGAYSDIRWDGTNSNGARCPMGPYIIWVEIVKPDGNIVVEKLDCVVSVVVR